MTSLTRSMQCLMQSRFITHLRAPESKLAFKSRWEIQPVSSISFKLCRNSKMVDSIGLLIPRDGYFSMHRIYTLKVPILILRNAGMYSTISSIRKSYSNQNSIMQVRWEHIFSQVAPVRVQLCNVA